MQSLFYCGLNRHYVAPELAEMLDDVAADVAARYPGTVTLVLDANFPLFDGFPLLPHVSHDDGRKADLAFYYADDTRYLPGAVRSPIGYFAFEDGPTHCPADAWPTLRWSFGWVQPLWRGWRLEPARTAYLVERLAQDARVSRVFLEPHLVQDLGLSHPKIRFQGCRVARHDDHIHVEI